MNVVTLIDGTEVDSASEAWRAECWTRHLHIETMRRLTVAGRRDYLGQVLRAEGDEAERRLRQAYADDWTKRKAAEDAERAPWEQPR